MKHQDLEEVVIERVYWAWLEEFKLEYYRETQVDLNTVEDRWDHEWLWAEREHVDPVKSATADQIGLETNTTTLSVIAGRQKQNWKKLIQQRGREIAFAKQNGVDLVVKPAQSASAGARASAFGDDDEPDSQDGFWAYLSRHPAVLAHR